MSKEIRYASVPDYFDQTKHYLVELEPVDMGEYIFIDLVVKDLDLTPSPEPEPYVEKPTAEERLEALESAMLEVLLNG